jgi:hypothetical protein
LLDAIEKYETKKKINWKEISNQLENKFTSVQCHQHYYRVISPELNRKSVWTQEEDDLLMSIVEKKGKKWALIAKDIKGRSDINCRQRYLAIHKKYATPNQKTTQTPNQKTQTIQIVQPTQNRMLRGSQRKVHINNCIEQELNSNNNIKFNTNIIKINISQNSHNYYNSNNINTLLKDDISNKNLNQEHPTEKRVLPDIEYETSKRRKLYHENNFIYNDDCEEILQDGYIQNCFLPHLPNIFELNDGLLKFENLHRITPLNEIMEESKKFQNYECNLLDLTCNEKDVMGEKDYQISNSKFSDQFGKDLYKLEEYKDIKSPCVINESIYELFNDKI